MPKPGSNAPFQVEIDFITGGRSIRIPSQNFFQALDVEAVSDGAWTGTLTLYDKDGEFLEDLLIGAGIDRYVRVRFNWQDDGLDRAPIYQGLVAVPQHVFLPDGIILNLELTAQPVIEAVADRRPRAFREGLTISEMVRAIASDRGWAVTDYFGTPTIEDTVDPMTEPFSAVGESDVAFIKNQLRKQAVNADGVGGYRFYFDPQGACHFHTDNFIRPRVKRYVYSRASDGEIIMFSPSETSYLAQIGGAGNAQFRSAASLPGSQVAKESSVESGLADGGQNVEATSTAVPDIGDGVSAILNITARDVEELERVANDRRTRMSQMHITAEMDVLGTHDVRVMDYVEVLYLKGNGRPHYLSGRYKITKHRHRVDNTGWRTTFSLSREGVLPQPGTVSRTGVRTVNPEEVA